jgi:hypothetical protein
VAHFGVQTTDLNGVLAGHRYRRKVASCASSEPRRPQNR